MLFLPRHTQQLKTTAHSKMTTIQKMMKQVEQQEKKQQEKLRQEEQQRGMIDNLNLYIPHARDDVSKEQMRENLSRFGKIKVIDFVAKLDKNNRNYNSAYVYFDSWYPTTENKQIQAQIKQYTKTQNKMQSFKLNYDGNLHWIILENTSPAPKPKEERKRTIDLKTPGTASVVTAPTEPASVVTAPVVTVPVVTAPVKRTMTIDDYNVSMTEKEVSEWHKFGDELRAKKRLQEEAAEKRFIEQEKKFSDEADQLLTRANPEDQELLQQEELQEDQDEDQEELQEDQEQDQEQEQEQEQEQYYYQSQMTQAFYNYYYWMTMEQRDMDEITTAMDEDDAWDAYLEQIHEECDFCENTLGRDEHEEQDGITTAVDYGYVERLEQELIKVRYQLRRSYS